MNKLFEKYLKECRETMQLNDGSGKLLIINKYKKEVEELLQSFINTKRSLENQEYDKLSHECQDLYDLLEKNPSKLSHEDKMDYVVGIMNAKLWSEDKENE